MESQIEDTKRTPELNKINSQLSELHNIAVGIGMRIRDFNDRVVGPAPEDENKSPTTAQTGSTIGGIQETIRYLQSSLDRIDNEAGRLDDIG